MKPTSDNRLLTVHDVARTLAVSPHTIYSWVAQRRIPFLKVGRLLRFDSRAIDAWLGQQGAGDAPIEPELRSELDRIRCGTRPERRS